MGKRAMGYWGRHFSGLTLHRWGVVVMDHTPYEFGRFLLLAHSYGEHGTAYRLRTGLGNSMGTFKEPSLAEGRRDEALDTMVTQHSHGSSGNNASNGSTFRKMVGGLTP